MPKRGDWALVEGPHGGWGGQTAPRSPPIANSPGNAMGEAPCGLGGCAGGNGTGADGGCVHATALKRFMFGCVCWSSDPLSFGSRAFPAFPPLGPSLAPGGAAPAGRWGGGGAGVPRSCPQHSAGVRAQGCLPRRRRPCGPPARPLVRTRRPRRARAEHCHSPQVPPLRACLCLCWSWECLEMVVRHCRVRQTGRGHTGGGRCTRAMEAPALH